MFKMIKYEIKGNYKFIIAMILAIVIASTIFQVSFKNNVLSFEEGMASVGPSPMGAFLLVISVLFIFGICLVTFLKIVGSFKDEINEDRGYLTFTLPLKGSQILGAKFITAIIWYLIISAIIIIYNSILVGILYKFDFELMEPIMQGIREIIKFGKSGIRAVFITGTLSTIGTLLLIYLSMTLGRVGFKNVKFGGFWFIIFIVISSVASYISNFVATKINYFISMDGFNIVNGTKVLTSSQVSFMAADFGHFYLNVGYLMFEIALIVGSFILTSYLIENKIDL